MANLI
jgi:branched-chain amino acid aminotransferase